MSFADRERWDRKHAARGADAECQAPSLDWIPVASRSNAIALDLACGTGRHLRTLGSRGYRVVGADVSRVALTKICTAANGTAPARIQMDVDAWPFGPECLDLVIQINFLDRTVLADAQSSVRRGGLFLLDSFAGNPADGDTGPKRPEHRLDRGELAERFRLWTIVRLEERPGPGGRAAVLAQKPY